MQNEENFYLKNGIFNNRTVVSNLGYCPSCPFVDNCASNLVRIFFITGYENEISQGLVLLDVAKVFCLS